MRLGLEGRDSTIIYEAKPYTIPDLQWQVGSSGCLRSSPRWAMTRLATLVDRRLHRYQTLRRVCLLVAHCRCMAAVWLPTSAITGTVAGAPTPSSIADTLPSSASSGFAMGFALLVEQCHPFDRSIFALTANIYLPPTRSICLRARQSNDGPNRVINSTPC